MLNERFEIIEEIGRGSQAVTYRARDHETGEDVALKELDFRRVENWKAQELFEREGATLRSLDHPGIPDYVDAFAVEDGDIIRLFVAQEFIDGQNLQDELESGGRWSEADALSDLDELLQILTYLHELAPPVIHRDIKPSNIMRRADGTLALVDFGAVQNVVPRTVGGSTIIGTPGYMPIEQVMGRAMPGSDLYALGATVVHLLTRTDPTLLPVERNELRFRDRLPRVTSELADVLEEMTRVSIEDRPESSRDLRDRLVPPEESIRVVIDEPEPEHELEPEPEPEPEIDRNLELPPELTALGPTDAVATGSPGWATTRVDGDVTLIQFDARDASDRLIDAVIERTPDFVELRVSSVSEDDRPTFHFGLLAGCILLAGFGGVSFFASVALFLLVSTLYWLAKGPLRGRRVFRLDHGRYRLAWDNAVSDNPVEIGGLDEISGVTVSENALWLQRRGSEPLRLMELAESESFRWDWLVYYFNLQLAEMRGEEVVLDHGVEEVAGEHAAVSR